MPGAYYADIPFEYPVSSNQKLLRFMPKKSMLKAVLPICSRGTPLPPSTAPQSTISPSAADDENGEDLIMHPKFKERECTSRNAQPQASGAARPSADAGPVPSAADAAPRNAPAPEARPPPGGPGKSSKGKRRGAQGRVNGAHNGQAKPASGPGIKQVQVKAGAAPERSTRHREYGCILDCYSVVYGHAA